MVWNTFCEPVEDLSRVDFAPVSRQLLVLILTDFITFHFING